MINLCNRMLLDPARIKPVTSWSPVGHASNWATKAGCRFFCTNLSADLLHQSICRLIVPVFLHKRGDRFTWHDLICTPFSSKFCCLWRVSVFNQRINRNFNTVSEGADRSLERNFLSNNTIQGNRKAEVLDDSFSHFFYKKMYILGFWYHKGTTKMRYQNFLWWNSKINVEFFQHQNKFIPQLQIRGVSR